MDCIICVDLSEYLPLALGSFYVAGWLGLDSPAALLDVRRDVCLDYITFVYRRQHGWQPALGSTVFYCLLTATIAWIDSGPWTFGARS